MTSSLRLGLLACVSLWWVACDGPTVPDAGTTDAATDPLAERPYESFVPSSYDPATPAPLVLVLHAYTGNGAAETAYLGMVSAAEAHGFLLAFPDGTRDSHGQLFWNATDACCDLDGASVDDVAYLTAVLDDLSARFSVDPSRVFVIGQSNGGFMAHRLACELGDRIAAAVSLAGMTWLDASACSAPGVTSILQIHGDADGTIPPEGGSYMGLPPFPSDAQTIDTWAQKNGCAGALEDAGAPLDLDTTLAGAETTTASVAGCPPGGSVELWTIHGADHAPNIDSSAFGERMWSYFDAHPRP